jgi:uncharacterized protein (DUF58 family)
MSDAHARPFALVPQRRFAGVRFGEWRSPRRGEGDEIAGTRAYRPGDRRALIDWRASARLSTARSADEFVVREFFADQAPRVMVVADRRPRMGVYGPPFPWLDKPAVVDAAIRLIVASTAAERGDAGYVDHVRGRPVWVAPRAPAEVISSLERRGDRRRFDAPPRSLEECLVTLTRHSSVLPAGTFVFVLSDFVDDVQPGAWARLRARCWDVTPVIVQDPVWEQSFPDVGGLIVPFADPETGRVAPTRFTRRQARARRAASEERLELLLARFRRLGFDPVLLSSADAGSVATAFEAWARRRRSLRRRIA